VVTVGAGPGRQADFDASLAQLESLGAVVTTTETLLLQVGGTQLAATGAGGDHRSANM
jgi:hypothetical protein